jgi:hypothetical protein
MDGNDSSYPGAHQDGKSVCQQKREHNASQQLRILPCPGGEEKNGKLSLVAHLGKAQASRGIRISFNGTISDTVQNRSFETLVIHFDAC